MNLAAELRALASHALSSPAADRESIAAEAGSLLAEACRRGLLKSPGPNALLENAASWNANAKRPDLVQFGYAQVWNRFLEHLAECLLSGLVNPLGYSFASCNDDAESGAVTVLTGETYSDAWARQTARALEWLAEVSEASNTDGRDYGDNFDRDKWMFENWPKYSRDGMRRWLEDHIKEKKWEPIDETAQRAAVKKYAAHIGKPVPKAKPGPKAKQG